MKTKKLIWIIRLIGIVFLFLFSSNQSFAVYPDIKIAIKTHYRGNADIEKAKKIFEEVVAESDRNNEDRKYALIFLAILSFVDKDTKQADNYLCQILNLKPDFDPDLSVRDITEDFKKRFSYLKKQNDCPNISSSCRGVKLVALKKRLKKCDELFNKGIIKNNEKRTAYSCYQKAERLCPNHPEVKTGFERVKNCDEAENKLKECRSGENTSCYQEARALCPNHPEFLKKCFGRTEKGEFETTTKCEVLEKRLEECEKQNNYTQTDDEILSKIKKLCQYHLQGCQDLLNKNVITTGSEETALSCYQKAQHLCPTHSSEIQQKFQYMEQKYINWAKIALNKIKNKPKLKKLKDYKKAQNALDGLRKVNPQSPKLIELERKLQQAR